MWSHLAPLIMWGVALLLSTVGVGVVVSLFCWVPPLVMRSTQTAKTSPFARWHATESLNLQLTALIISVIYVVLVFGGLAAGMAGAFGGFGIAGIAVVVGLAYCVVVVVQMIIATVKAHGGDYYRYWVNFRMVKS